MGCHDILAIPLLCPVAEHVISPLSGPIFIAVNVWSGGDRVGQLESLGLGDRKISTVCFAGYPTMIAVQDVQPPVPQRGQVMQDVHHTQRILSAGDSHHNAAAFGEQVMLLDGFVNTNV